MTSALPQIMRAARQSLARQPLPRAEILAAYDGGERNGAELGRRFGRSPAGIIQFLKRNGRPAHGRVLPEQPLIPNEVWLPTPGWEGKYEVSNHGRVRKAGGRLLSLSTCGSPYLSVHLSSPRRQVTVHRLVATAFVPNPERKPVVNHLDCVVTNNLATNLEWCTQRENIHHSVQLGRVKFDNTRGRRPHNASLSDEQAREARRLFASGEMSRRKIAALFGVNSSVIEHLIKGRAYRRVSSDAGART